MNKRSSAIYKNNESKPAWIIKVLSLILFLFLNIYPLRLLTDSVVVFLGYPFIMLGNSLKTELQFVGAYFSNTNNLYKDYVYLQQEYAKCEAKSAKEVQLEEENKALKEQLNVTSPQVKFIMAKEILVNDDVLGVMILNVGAKSGVNPGDFVVEGYNFVGKIVSVTPGTSKVILPFNRKSRLKVFIAKNSEPKGFIGKGVAIGDGVSIKIDNIVGDKVANDDLVFIAEDENYWLLGKLDDLSDDPTSPFKTAVVHPLVDTAITKTYFIPMSN